MGPLCTLVPSDELRNSKGIPLDPIAPVNLRAAIIAAQIRDRYPTLKSLRIQPNMMTNWVYVALCEGGWMKAWEDGTWELAAEAATYLLDLADQTHVQRPPAPGGPEPPGVVAPGK